MSSVLDVSSLYDSYSSQLSNVSAGSASDKISGVNKDSSDEELMEACKTFESYFIEQAIKGMEKTIPDNDDSSASYLNMFKDTLYQEYADIASNRGDGIGIAKMLYEQMKRNYNI